MCRVSSNFKSCRAKQKLIMENDLIIISDVITGYSGAAGRSWKCFGFGGD
jgi:hypothetical protein